MNESARTANLLGAAALTLADQLTSAVTVAGGTSASGAAALVTLLDDPGLGVTELGARIGLSQPAAARMVDSLAARGLVQRQQGPTGRSVALHPTEHGRDAARHVLECRLEALARLVDGLETDEREALTRGLEKLLDALFEEVGSEYVLCRLCDRRTCTAGGAPCPVGQAARDRGDAGDG